MKKRMPFEKNTRQSSQLQGNKFSPKWAVSNTRAPAPYSRQVQEKRLKWNSLNIHIFAGEHRWRRAHRRNTGDGPGCGLVLPTGMKPEAFNWPVKGCQLFVCMDKSDTRKSALSFAQVLHAQGAELIVMMYGRSDAPALYVQDASWEAGMSDSVILELPWPQPESLPVELPSVMTLDRNLLPSVIGDYVYDAADRINCPPDYLVVTIMCGFGSVVGRQLAIRPKQKDDWEVIPNLWGAIIGSPSSRKSPAINAGFMPLKKLDDVARENQKVDMREYENAEFAHDLAIKAAKASATRKLRNDQSEIGQRNVRVDMDAVRNSKPKPPNRRVYSTQDATPEKLGELLNQNPNGFMVSRDELMGWMSELDKQGREGSRSFFLQAWNGNDSYRVDRIGRGTVEITALSLSVFGGIQPDKLRRYFRKEIGGNASDGLLARFQMSVWPDSVKIQSIDRCPDQNAIERVEGLFTWAANLPVADIGAIQGKGRVPYLRFTARASTMFSNWETRLRKRAQDEVGAMESHLCKYPSMVATIALLIHLANQETGSVTEDAVEKAILWAEYLESHARRIYSPLQTPEIDSAQKLLAKVEKGKLDRQFTIRDVYRHQWSGLTTPNKVLEAAEVLEEYGWLRIEEPVILGGVGRPTSPLCNLNPALAFNNFSKND